MASTTTSNFNEILPGLESFLHSMVNSVSLDRDHRQIAAMYIAQLDKLGKTINHQEPTQMADDQSIVNTNIAIDDDSDDFTDEEEEERKKELEREQQQQQQPSTPSIGHRSLASDNYLYQSTRSKSSSSTSQWYMDVPKNGYLEALTPQLSIENNDSLSSKTPSRMSISTPSSTVIADGLLLTYDENHNWIWRYYVLDDFDLICFPADKKSSSTNPTQSDNDCSPLWVSDMTNAKVHTTVIDKVECLCLQIGLAEAIYVRPPDPSQMEMWLKAFREAASSHKTKDNAKGRNNVKTLSRNARRIFAQFNRKKGQIVSHLLDQMANVTGVDEKTRKNCELRGFLVVSLDNITFVTKYCTIVDGIFRIHKSRLSEQTEHELCLNRCTLTFPEERTRDIQFALIDDEVGTVFIRGNNIYSMGRLLNTLAKYVEITGSTQFVFTPGGSGNSTPLSRHRKASTVSSQAHIYSDVDASSIVTTSQSNDVFLPSTGQSEPASSLPVVNMKKPIYHNASRLHDNDIDDRAFISPIRRLANETNGTPSTQQHASINKTYDQPKSYDNVALLSTAIDRNNNHVVIQPQKSDNKTKTDNGNIHSEVRLSSANNSQVHRSKSKLSNSNAHNEPPSSPEKTVFCLRAADTSTKHRRHSRHHRENPVPRRSSTQTTPSDYVNRLANLFTKGFSTPSPTVKRSTSNEHHTSTQTYDTASNPSPSCLHKNLNESNKNKNNNFYNVTREQEITKRVYDIPIQIERSKNNVSTSYEQQKQLTIRNSRSAEPLSSPRYNEVKYNDDDETETPYSQGYDNLVKNEGIGKFRFVVPFNHSPTSAFISNPTMKKMNSPTNSSSSATNSYSTIRQTTILSNKNANLNNNNSNTRSTLMTAV